jgi:hypothetical protein
MLLLVLCGPAAISSASGSPKWVESNALHSCQNFLSSPLNAIWPRW